MTPKERDDLLQEIATDVRLLRQRQDEHTSRIIALETADRDNSVFRARSGGIYLGIAGASAVLATVAALLIQYLLTDKK